MRDDYLAVARAIDRIEGARSVTRPLGKSLRALAAVMDAYAKELRTADFDTSVTLITKMGDQLKRAGRKAARPSRSSTLSEHWLDRMALRSTPRESLKTAMGAMVAVGVVGRAATAVAQDEDPEEPVPGQRLCQVQAGATRVQAAVG